MVIQGVFGHVEISDGVFPLMSSLCTCHEQSAGGAAKEKASRMVFIGRVEGIEEELRQGMQKCISPLSANRRRVVPQMAGNYGNHSAK